MRALRLTADGRLADVALLGGAPLQRLVAVLQQEGDAARVVGGAVRNALLGRPIADIDVATTAEPGVVVARVLAAGWRAIPTGIDHGTVTVVVDGHPFEVTTLRRDVETDGRHAVVRFSRDFVEDAQRRDFTINALSVDRDGTLHDAVGGLADLAAGRVRFIGDPDRRITEDALRILRFFRFHAAYGLGSLDVAGLAATTRHRAALGRLSRERVRAEILKLLAEEGAPAVVRAMVQAGIATQTLEGSPDPERLERLADLEVRHGLAPDALLRLAALAVHDKADAARLRDRLRLANDEGRRLSEAAEARAHLDPAGPPDRAACLALLFACGPSAARDGVLLAAASAPAGVEAGWRAAFALVGSEMAPVLPIGGAAVMARGIAGGRRVGVVLKLFQAAWIRAGFPRDPAVIAAVLDEAIAAESGGS